MLSNSAHYVMRRIIMEFDKPFKNADDNNNVYFCAFTTSNNGDMLFGNIDSSVTIR